MHGFAARVNALIEKSDIILEILDARFPQQTRNIHLENKILNMEKKLVFVLNKSDLVSKNFCEKAKRELEKTAPAVFISSTEKMGIKRLKGQIGIFSEKEKNLVGVIGYPNMGKSSVINALAGRKSAKTSIKAGFTRGEQYVRVSNSVLLIDSPGIIPFEEKNEFLLCLVGSKNPEQLKDIESTATQFIEFLKKENPKILKKEFGIEIEGKNSDKILEEIALKKGRLLKGGIADTQTIARQIILDWQKGKIKV